ncbi:N-glycosylase/DNA lyase [Candidatus Woesearchaeota archaeon]|nr:N-glycosylase/DNA lyase [Candidatus Woesearchaeota archaeon]
MKILKEDYKNKKEEILDRLKEFENNKDYFYELCFCILTPQSSAKTAWECIKKLKKADFKNNDVNPQSYIKPIRFYKNKSRYLLELKNNYSLVLKNIKQAQYPKQLREFLVNNVKGYGYKEASHFLRNIGHKDVAILDRHILKNLKKYKIIKEIPDSLTPKKYCEIEDKFLDFSRKINIPMDHLDLLFWSQETGEIFK